MERRVFGRRKRLFEGRGSLLVAVVVAGVKVCECVLCFCYF